MSFHAARAAGAAARVVRRSTGTGCNGPPAMSIIALFLIAIGWPGEA
jgi:hypothetical protein